MGEDHQRARLADADVESMLELSAQGWGCRRLAKAFECSKSQVRRIVKGQQRAQRAVDWRKVPVPADDEAMVVV